MTRQAENPFKYPDGGAPERAEPLSFDQYHSLSEAGRILGLSGPALRKKFERGDLPRRFLLRIGPRTLRVDIAGLVKFLKGQASQMSA
jgi:hypothetical protein